MRWLPCSRCPQGASGGPQREPLLVAHISARGFLYKCSACRTVQKISPAEFQSLPSYTPDQFAWEAANGKFRDWPGFAAMVISHFMD